MQKIPQNGGVTCQEKKTVDYISYQSSGWAVRGKDTTTTNKPKGW